MTKIEVLQTFSDDGQLYVAGEVRLVSQAKAAYFCGAGWCRAAGFDVGSVPTDVTLEIQDGNHFTGVTFHG